MRQNGFAIWITTSLITTCLVLVPGVAMQAQAPESKKAVQKPKLSPKQQLSMRLLHEAEQISRHFTPEERADLLLDLSRTINVVEKKESEQWSLEIFNLATTVIRPGPYRLAMQKNALTTLALVDADKAAKLYVQQDSPPKGENLPLEDVRSFGARTLFPQLWKNGGMSSLPEIETVAAYLGATGQYPYVAMAAVVPKVAEQDPDKAATLFGDATNYLSRDPGFASTNRDFINFILQTYQSVSSASLIRQAINAALESIDNAELDKRYSKQFEVKTSKGVFRVSSEREVLAYRLLPVVRQIDSKWAESLKERYTALQNLPQLASDDKVTISATISDQQRPDPVATRRAMDQHKLFQVEQLANTDPNGAMDLANSINDLTLKNVALATVAGAFFSKDPKEAQALLGDATESLEKMPPDVNKLRLLVKISKARFMAGDQRGADAYADRGLDLGEELFSQDMRSNPGKMAYSAAGFDEIAELLHVLAQYDSSSERVVRRVRQIRNETLKARALGVIAQGLLDSQAKA